MYTIRFSLLASILLLAGLSFACSETTPEQPAANTAPTNTAGAPDTVKVEPKIVRDDAGPDNSHITIRQLESGDTVAVRTWEAGPVKKVKRREQNGQAKHVRVTYRDGSEVKVEDRDAITNALEWTGEQINTIARKVGKAVKKGADEGEDIGEDVGEASEGVADKTVEGAKKVGSEVADKSEDVAEKTVEGGKKVGGVVADKTVEGAKKVGEGAKKVGEKLKP